MKKPRSLYVCFIKFIENHYHTINILFLTIYIILELELILSANFLEGYKLKLFISILIIFFLYVIGVERIILQFKSKKGQEEKDKIEKQYYESELQKQFLIEKNKRLVKQIKFIKKFLKQSGRLKKGR